MAVKEEVNIQEEINKISIQKTQKILNEKKKESILIKLFLENKLEGITIEELLESYPHLKKEDILAVLSYSADVISQEEIIAI